MATPKQNAIDLYMGAIRDGNPVETLDRIIGDRYTQHSTGVADGKEGFLEFFLPFLERTPVREMEIKRALQDGRKVFVHCYQNLNEGAAQWVTMDFFDTDDSAKIIEHWDVIAAYSDSNPSGRSNIDGATEITDLDQTEANKATIRKLVEEGLIGRNIDVLRDVISDTTYIQHSPDVGDGREVFLERFAPDDCPLAYHKLHLLVGEGNFVATLCETSWDGAAHCQTDLFRLENGVVVEHWDASEPIGPKETWNNGGKF